MTLDDFLFNKREILESLKKIPPSHARTTLLKLLKLKNLDLILATIDSWFESRAKVRPFNTITKIPKKLIPNTSNHQELFQYMTDRLKRSIG